MLDKIQLADIRSFVLIAQLGNFTKAADHLQVSRSHVSRQISQLEAQMGVTLLVRTTRRLKLTDAGERFYLQCQQALQQIDQAVLAAVDDIEQIRGELRINCVGGYLGEEWVASMVAEFLACHPDVNIELDFSSHRVDLIDEDFDLAFRMGKLDDAGFVARKLASIPMVTLASPEYLARYGVPSNPKALEQHSCLTGSVTRWSYQSCDGTQQQDVHVSGALHSKNGRVLVKAATMGNGIIRVPSVYCEPEMNAGQLIEVFEQWWIPDVDFSLVYHRDRYQPKRLRAFIEFVVARVASLMSAAS